MRKSFVVLMATLASASIWCLGAFAQSPQASGQPNQHSVTAARSRDLSGVWLFDEKRYHDDPTLYLLPAKKAPPMTSWGQQKYDEAKPGTRGGTGDSDNDPTFHCDPPGLPRIANGREGPFEIVQVPGRILILYENFQSRRQIWMDGRPLPSDPDPTWYGYSIGKWDGDTLVVDTIGFNDKSWLDGDGHPHSDAMRIEERYRRADHDTLELTMKIDDPKAYTKPWMSAEPKIFKLRPKLELMELPCVPENEENFLKTVREPAAPKPSK